MNQEKKDRIQGIGETLVTWTLIGYFIVLIYFHLI